MNALMQLMFQRGVPNRAECIAAYRQGTPGIDRIGGLDAIITGTYGPGEAGTKTLPASPALFAALGTTGGFFSALGVPQALTYDQGVAGANEVRVFKGSKWELWYSANQCESIAHTWTNNVTYPYETFTTSEETISSAINSSGYGTAYSEINFGIGVEYHLIIDLTLNSGVAPQVSTGSDTDAGAGGLTYQQLVDGRNEFMFTLTGLAANNTHLWLMTSPTDVCNFSATSFIGIVSSDMRKAIRFVGPSGAIPLNSSFPYTFPFILE